MKRRPALVAVAGLVVAALAQAAPRVAAAQPGPDLARAKQWFKEGDEADRKQAYALALGLFEKALAVKATPQLYLRIGACQEHLGHLAAALEAYQQGLERSQGPAYAAVAAVAREQLDALEPRVPAVLVTVAKSYPGLTVTLDGGPLPAASLGTKLPLDPGTHRLHAEAAGYLAKDQTFTLAERDALKVELALPLAASPEGAVPLEEPGVDAPAPAPHRPRLPYLLLGGGVAAVAGGVAMFAAGSGKSSEVDSLCGGSARLLCPRSREAEINGDVSAINALHGASVVALVLGVAAAGAGTFLLVSRPKEPAAGGSPAATGWVQVVPAVGAGEARVQAFGRF